ncbi:MAG TPA: phage portal protein [Mycobacterium sp.]|nr:phage portal protein [Mycobacterium sp.]
MSVLRNLTRRRPTAVASSTQAQPRVPLVGRFRSPLSSLYNGGSDPEQQMEMFGRSGTLYSVVTLNASSFSTVNWRLFRTHDGRGRISGPDPRTEVKTHAAIDVWNNPNPWMTGQLFRESYQQHLELTGQAFWVISYVGGIPKWMWPVRPDRMAPAPDVQKFIAGWVYTGPNGEQVPLQNSEVVWLRQPHPLNPYGGMGAVEPLMPDIESARFVSEFYRNFFRNSAMPGGFVQFPENVRLSDDDFTELTERWAEQHQGVQRAHRVAFLEMGATWQSADMSMKDMQFTELRQDGRDIIYEGFGTSKSLLGVTEDVNRANAEANEYVFAKYRQVVKLERSKDALNGQFMPLFKGTSQGVAWDYDNPIPADWQADAQSIVANAQALSLLVNAGFDADDSAQATSFPNVRHTGVIPTKVMPVQVPPSESSAPASTEKEAA